MLLGNYTDSDIGNITDSRVMLFSLLHSFGASDILLEIPDLHACLCWVVINCCVRGMQVEAISFEEDLQDRWAAEALRWALHCSSRHLTERSHQVPSHWLPEHKYIKW